MKIATPKDSMAKSEEGSEFVGSDIRYSYKDFRSVDHRIKLHIILNVFEHENEDLALFLRVSTCFVSTNNLSLFYIHVSLTPFT